MDKHTPTPLEVTRLDNGQIAIKCKRGLVAIMEAGYGKTREEDAAFIVTACNAYEKDQEIKRELLARVRLDGMAFHQSDNKYNLHEPLFRDCKHIECVHYKSIIASAVEGSI